MQMILGVIEGQIRGGYFPDYILDPSMIDPRGHPPTVPQFTKDHLKSIISLAPDWPGEDTTQIILGILAHPQRVSSSPVRADEI